MRSDTYTKPPFIFVIGLNHKTAPLEVREKFYLKEDALPLVLNNFKDILSECMIVSTCNRFELYGVSEDLNVDLDLIRNRLIEFAHADSSLGEGRAVRLFYEFILCGAVTHLFRVAASVDSMVVGDSQIFNQVKEAYRIALENGSAGKLLNQVVQKALHTAKKSRTETTLFEGAFSISYAAVELAMKIFGDLAGKKVLVIGAGKTSELTVQSLIKKKADHIYITNRTKENADRLAESLKQRYSVEASSVPFEDFKSMLDRVDIVISSTGSSEYIIKRDEFKAITKKRRGDPILIIDIAVPRDIDPAVNGLEGVFLKNIDDLNVIMDADYDRRMAVVPNVDIIINREVDEFLKWYYSIPVLPALKYVQQSSNGLKEIKRITAYIEQNVSGLQERMSWRQTEDIMNIHNLIVSGLKNLNARILNNGTNIPVCETCEYVGRADIHICPPVPQQNDLSHSSAIHE